MTETDAPEPQSAAESADRPSDARRTRGIRFSDPEWEDVRSAAERHDMPAAEFVRERILDIARAGPGPDSPGIPAQLTPLIERTFRYAYILATLKRDEMVAAGRGEEIDALAETVRELENSLKRGVPEGPSRPSTIPE